MVPAAVVDKTISNLLPYLDPGDIVIDGGNSYYIDDIRRAKDLASKGIHYVDVGTSGGVWGLERGYCMMIGGEERRSQASRSDLRDARARGGRHSPHARTRKGRRHGRARLSSLRSKRRWPLRKDGPQRHRVRHHGGLRRRTWNPSPCQHRQTTTVVDAETTPLRNPEHYQYDLNLRDIAELWRRGSVVASWLLDLTAIALAEDPALSKFAGRVSDSGEGRWTIKAAIDEACRCRCCLPRSTSASAPVARQTMRTSCYRRCVSSSADTWKMAAKQAEEDIMSDSHSDAFVFFGATGDLAYKKIFPSLQAMVKRGTSQRAGYRRRQVRLEPRPVSGSGVRQPRETRRG